MVKVVLVLLMSTLFVVIAHVLTQNSENFHNEYKFKTIWNMPTFQCSKYGIDFKNLTKKYGIIQNQKDQFVGDKIALLYDPGDFPAILNFTEGQLLRNGGVPQKGNLTSHLLLLEKKIKRSIPNKKFSGLGVIDMESWRPIYEQNYGTLLSYKELSIKLEKRQHPNWTRAQLENEAERNFETSARLFMQKSINLAKKLRPLAFWGYYVFPVCFNYKQQNCPSHILPLNDRLSWLFNETDYLFPSLYLRAEDTAHQRIDSIIGRIQESQRVLTNLSIEKTKGIFPYFTVKYPDNDQFLTYEDISKPFILLKRFKVDGWIIWGSSDYVNSADKCKSLYNYVDTVFGPALNSYF